MKVPRKSGPPTDYDMGKKKPSRKKPAAKSAKSNPFGGKKKPAAAGTGDYNE